MAGNPVDKPYFEDLGDFGTNWVHECLEKGTTFAKLVQSEMNLEKGNTLIAITMREQASAIAEKQSLDWATTHGSDGVDVQRMMLLEKLRELEKDRGSLVVVGIDDVRDITPEKYTSPSLPYIKYKDLYLYWQRVSEIKSYQDFAVLEMTVRYSNNDFIVPLNDLPHGNRLTDEEATSLAASVVAIVNSAYHGETFTIWVKNPL
jgi:hypothetical protein